MTDPAASQTPPSVAAIVVAGGSGTRFGAAKQFARLGERRVLDWSLAAARTRCDPVILVVPADSVAALAADPATDADVVVAGGATRSASVRAGLAAVPVTADIVVVHDAARPLADSELFEAVIDAVGDGADAAVPGVPVADTLRLRSGGVPPFGRDDLVAVQTPQAFAASKLRRAHAEAAEATDDASLIDAAGGRVVIVPGDPVNRKITDPADLVIAEALVAESVRS